MEIYGFIDGEKKSLTQLAAESGVSYDTLFARYKAGVPFGELVNKPEENNGSGISVADILECVYPVGAVYISTVATNPKTLFGFGTWQQIQDRFLLAAGSSYAAGATGGGTLQKNLGLTGNSYGGITTGGSYKGRVVCSIQNYANENDSYMSLEGMGIDIMPPYLAVYVWQRVS